jgi:BirA family transcriptional regulator, biotin operon repressor / biotin---[acetyl-CoA-carboxylase] ligase
MDATTLQALLEELPLGPIRYYDRLGSTNDEAARWAEAGAPDLALVVADEQIAGRGRLNRRWYTPPGSALAFSLVLRPEASGSGPVPVLQPAARAPNYPTNEKTDFAQLPAKFLPRLSALGALAVCTALRERFDLSPQVKWPNDVLVERKKLAGVLAEAIWDGGQLSAAILGIGVNVAPPSEPPEAEVSFPATCVEAVLGRQVDRWDFLRAILTALLGWRSRLASPEFWQAWEDALAFRGERVYLHVEGQEPLAGELLGLDPEGALRLRTQGGELTTLQIGEVRLRPVDSLPGSAKLDGER